MNELKAYLNKSIWVFSKTSIAIFIVGVLLKIHNVDVDLIYGSISFFAFFVGNAFGVYFVKSHIEELEKNEKTK